MKRAPSKRQFAIGRPSVTHSLCQLTAFLLNSGKDWHETKAEYKTKLHPEDAAIGALLALRSLADWYVNDVAETKFNAKRQEMVSLEDIWPKGVHGLIQRYKILPELLGTDQLDDSRDPLQRFNDIIRKINDLVEHHSNAWQLSIPWPKQLREIDPDLNGTVIPRPKEISLSFASQATLAFLEVVELLAHQLDEKIPSWWKEPFEGLRNAAKRDCHDDYGLSEKFSTKAKDLSPKR